jgi:RNA polymerase sigma-70 factor (sigma-E family)
MDERRRQGHARVEFDRFVDDTAETLLRSAYLIAWDFAEAEDLVQECLFRVARRWPRVRKMDHPTAYARSVLVHLALDGSKRRSRRRAELGPASTVFLEASQDDSAVHIIARVDASTDLLCALGGLPPRQRVALVLRYFEDLSEAETATVMGCSVGTVKSTTSRALDRLRQSMEEPLGSAHPIDASASTNTSTRAQATEGSITA